jgi:acyl-CoA thioester hydrolase
MSPAKRRVSDHTWRRHCEQSEAIQNAYRFRWIAASLRSSQRQMKAKRMSLTDFKFCHRMRVRYGEVDMQGVVFNARYLDYGDIGVTEYWRAVGFRFTGEDVMEFHVARAEVDFKKPIYPDEDIALWVRTERIGNSSMTVLIELHGAAARSEGDLRAIIREVQVHVDLATHRPIPIPDTVKQRFLDFDQRDVVLVTP